jgi:hypothetical protein
MTENINTLLIGGFSSGKTHFGAQLLARLQKKSGELELREAAPSVALFEEALTRLAAGMSSEHTARQMFGDIKIPTADRSGRGIDLIWPEYGGEQVDDIASKRLISPRWRKRTRECDHWVLLIRLLHIKTEDDLVSRPLDKLYTERRQADNRPKENAFNWSSQALLLELMQLLLYVREQSTCRRLYRPKLLVLLSCWDEMPVTKMTIPGSVLASELPMFYSYLRANWDEDALTICGLSSLSRNLKPDVPDPEYVDRGPEAFGYIVLPDGTETSDLTLPIARLAVGSKL